MRRTHIAIQSRWYLLLCLACAFALEGCGADTSAAPAAPAGIYVDSTTEAFLQAAFIETKECTGFESGSFENLAVVIMPPDFDCQHYSSGCSGEFVAPNSVKISNPNIWRHELVHYFLFVNTGDIDKSHQSPLFDACA